VNLSTEILGSTTVKALRARGATPVLTIGKDALYRKDFAKIDCWNFTAAQILSKKLNEELHVKDLRDLYDRIAPHDLAIPGVGIICLAVLGAAFESRKIGGMDPLKSWYNKHRVPTLTFDTVKHRLKKELEREHKAERAKRRAEQRQEAADQS